MSRAVEVRDVSVRFGGLQALQDVSIDVGEWEIVGLIGPNGAGKTTFFNVITGIQRSDSGRVVFRGQDVTRTPTHKRVRLGIGRTGRTSAWCRRSRCSTTCSPRSTRASGTARSERCWGPRGRS